MAATLLMAVVVAAGVPVVSLAQPAADDIGALIANMSNADKVGQLFLLSFSGQTATGAAPAIADLRAGGIVLIANAATATAARSMTADLQQQAVNAGVLPLMVAINQEGGAIQPISVGITPFDWNWQIGQIQPLADALTAACQRGLVQGRELQAMGINTNLAPVLDVLDNSRNTVIGQHAFSGDPDVVATLGAGYIEALQSQGVLAIGKHFPGHGSTMADSHLQLPVVWHDRSWLHAHELVPFRAAIQSNVAGIMVAHISFPNVDSSTDRPSSLSPAIVRGMLRSDLGYGGLIMTDDLGAMQAVTNTYLPEEAAIQAIEAGSDMLIVVGTVEHQRRMVQAVLGQIGGRIGAERLEESVKRVVNAKQQARLIGSGDVSMRDSNPMCPPGSL